MCSAKSGCCPRRAGVTLGGKQKPSLKKGRLVARGFLQDISDSGDVWSPVARPETVRTLIAWSAAHGRSVVQVDVTGAYTKSLMDGPPVYVSPPSKEYAKPGHVLQLRRSLYGLRSSGAQWYDTLCEYLRQQGMRPTKSDPCLFTNSDKSIVLAIYVDDILFSVSHQKLADDFIARMNEL